MDFVSFNNYSQQCGCSSVRDFIWYFSLPYKFYSFSYSFGIKKNENVSLTVIWEYGNEIKSLKDFKEADLISLISFLSENPGSNCISKYGIIFHHSEGSYRSKSSPHFHGHFTVPTNSFKDYDNIINSGDSKLSLIVAVKHIYESISTIPKFEISIYDKNDSTCESINFRGLKINQRFDVNNDIMINGAHIIYRSCDGVTITIHNNSIIWYPNSHADFRLVNYINNGNCQLGPFFKQVENDYFFVFHKNLNHVALYLFYDVVFKSFSLIDEIHRATKFKSVNDFLMLYDVDDDAIYYIVDISSVETNTTTVHVEDKKINKSLTTLLDLINKNTGNINSLTVDKNYWINKYSNLTDQKNKYFLDDVQQLLKTKDIFGKVRFYWNESYVLSKDKNNSITELYHPFLPIIAFQMKDNFYNLLELLKYIQSFLKCMNTSKVLGSKDECYGCEVVYNLKYFQNSEKKSFGNIEYLSGNEEISSNNIPGYNTSEFPETVEWNEVIIYIYMKPEVFYQYLILKKQDTSSWFHKYLEYGMLYYVTS